MISVNGISGMGCMNIRIIMNMNIDEICPMNYLLKRHKVLFWVAHFTNRLWAHFLKKKFEIVFTLIMYLIIKSSHHFAHVMTSWFEHFAYKSKILSKLWISSSHCLWDESQNQVTKHGTYVLDSSPPRQNGRQFARRHFQMEFVEWKWQNIDSNFTEI